MTTKTAILIFANSAQFEATQKPFQFSAELFDTLNTQTLKIVKQTGLPYFNFSEKNQFGASFGERFTNAIQSVYNKGFDRVITIGNDTPHLQTQHLLKAEQQLDHNDMVLGPSKDGGFYLMGLKQSCFNRETFLRLPWQTSQLHRAFSKQAVSQQHRLTYLEILSDIDSIADAKPILESFRRISKLIKQRLLHLILIEKKQFSFLIRSIETQIQIVPINKGSPLLLAL